MSEADPFPEKKLLLGSFAGRSRNPWCNYLGACNRYHQISNRIRGTRSRCACRLRFKNWKRRKGFRNSGRVPRPFRLHSRKLFFDHRLRISRATYFLLHAAEQCRTIEGYQRNVGRFHVGERSILRDCRLRRLQVLSDPTVRRLFST
jgi:hypothetical protein